MPLRVMPVFALALGSVLMASCAKQPAAPPPPAPAAAAQPAGPTGGQSTNFEDSTQTQAPAAPTPSN
jgi:hypothetical protein